MIDLLQLCAFNAAYAHAIDSDALDEWPAFFTEDCLYQITHAGNEQDELAPCAVHAESHAVYGSVKIALELERRDDLESACPNTVAAAMR